MTPADEQRALHNCHRVRTAYPVAFLQVLPDPYYADNVQLRFNGGPWRTLHVIDALALVKLARRRRGRLRLLDPAIKRQQRKAAEYARRRARAKARQYERALAKERQLDRSIYDMLVRGQSLLDNYGA